jgi:hypothetical protein
MPRQKSRSKTALGCISSSCAAYEAGVQFLTYPPDPPRELASFFIYSESSFAAFLKPER